MKKKATSSSSVRSSFQSLREAKDFVDQCFDKLIDLYTSGYNASQIYGGYLVLKDESEDRRSSRKELRKELQDKASEDLLSLGPQLLQICSDLCLLDPFGESRELFDLLSDQIELWSIRKRSSLGYWDFRERAESERKRIVDGLPGFLAYQNSLEQSKPKRGRRPKADLKSRDNRELLIAILLKHHRYESKDGLKIDPISTKEASQALGKSESTLSKTWEKVQPTLTYERYVKLCGHFKTLEKFLKAIDSKEGYLERSNKEGSIDRSEG